MLKIEAKNRAAIRAMLAEANGRADTHTYQFYSEIEALAQKAEARLDDLGIPKAQRKEAIYRSTSGKRVACGYDQVRNATVVELRRRAGGWYLTMTARAIIGTEAPDAVLTLTADQDAKAIAFLRSGYRVAV
jgi:hypothetical protein